MEPIGAVAAFKNVYSITKGLVKFSATKEFKDEIIKLQDAIFSANERYSTLLEENNELKSQVAKLKAWNREKKRYKLVELYRSNFAYTLKEAEKGGEPMHYICPSCYKDGKGAILQGVEYSTGENRLKCSACTLDILESFE